MRIYVDSVKSGQAGSNQTITLPYAIDNTKNEYCVYLKDVSYYVGYYNVSAGLGNNTIRYKNETPGPPGVKTITLPDGYYSLDSYFSLIKQFISSNGDNPDNINYYYKKSDGGIILSFKNQYQLILGQFSGKLLGFVPLPSMGFFSSLPIGLRTSSRPVAFNIYKKFYIHLKQINNSTTLLNGNPDDILARIPVTDDPFGTLIYHRIEFPYINQLTNTTISKLDITITDEFGNLIDFHGLPVYFTIEIEKNK